MEKGWSASDFVGQAHCSLLKLYDCLFVPYWIKNIVKRGKSCKICPAFVCGNVQKRGSAELISSEKGEDPMAAWKSVLAHGGPSKKRRLRRSFPPPLRASGFALPKIFRVTENTACCWVQNIQCSGTQKTGRILRPVPACSPANLKRRTFRSRSRHREQNCTKTEWINLELNPSWNSDIRKSIRIEVLASWSHGLCPLYLWRFWRLKDRTLLFRRLCTPATDANRCHSDANHCHRGQKVEKAPLLSLYSLPKP